MLPSCYHILGAFPTLISGKVDRVSLGQMALDQPLFPGATTSMVTTSSSDAPVSKTLDTIIDVFRSVLKLGADQAIKSPDTFFELGGQSVLALRLQAILKRKLKQEITLMQLFENLSPAKLSLLIESKSTIATGAVPHSTSTPDAIDWDRETSLPDDHRYRPTGETILKDRRKTTAILLLGGDSFIGLFMLRALLTSHPDATIYVLGTERSLDLDELLRLFQANQLLDANVSPEWLHSHACPVAGSMVQPNFGLDQGEFSALGAQVQEIFHTGGHVSLLQTYSDLCQCNVESVSSMIRLAALGAGPGVTALHYISTWSAVHMPFQSLLGYYQCQN